MQGDGRASRGERLPKSARVHRGSEIVALLRNGRRRREGPLEFFWLLRSGSGCRVGVVVPKYGHGGVERNRLRRRLKEIARRGLLPAWASCGVEADVVVRARREAYGVPFEELVAAVDRFGEGVCSAQSSSG